MTVMLQPVYDKELDVFTKVLACYVSIAFDVSAALEDILHLAH